VTLIRQRRRMGPARPSNRAGNRCGQKPGAAPSTPRSRRRREGREPTLEPAGTGLAHRNVHESREPQIQHRHRNGGRQGHPVSVRAYRIRRREGVHPSRARAESPHRLAAVGQDPGACASGRVRTRARRGLSRRAARERAVRRSREADRRRYGAHGRADLPIGKTRTGAQLILQGTRFASREVLTLRPYADEIPASSTISAQGATP
jgi:hypothetical protein